MLWLIQCSDSHILTKPPPYLLTNTYYDANIPCIKVIAQVTARLSPQSSTSSSNQEDCQAASNKRLPDYTSQSSGTNGKSPCSAKHILQCRPHAHLKHGAQSSPRGRPRREGSARRRRRPHLHYDGRLDLRERSRPQQMLRPVPGHAQGRAAQQLRLPQTVAHPFQL